MIVKIKNYLPIIIVFFLTASTLGLAKERPEFYVYNWSNYIDKNVIVDFEALHKVRVKYKVYDSISELRELLKKLSYSSDARTVEIDVVIMPIFILQGLIEQNLLAPIRTSKLRNNKYVFTSLKKFIKKTGQDIGRTKVFASPYLWGTTALAYNATELNKRSRTFPRDNWDLIFNPNIASQFSDCGIIFSDRPHQIFQILRNYLNKDPRSTHSDDLLEVEIILRALRPYVDVMSGFETANAFAYGDACIVLGQSQEIFLAQKNSKTVNEEMRQPRSRRRTPPPQLIYKFPKQGSLIWMDVMVIPIQSKKIKLAHLWIDHILNAENNSSIAKVTGFASPISRSLKLLPKSIRSSKTLYPNLKNKKMFVDAELLDANNLPTLELREKELRAWERFINLRK